MILPQAVSSDILRADVSDHRADQPVISISGIETREDVKRGCRDCIRRYSRSSI